MGAFGGSAPYTIFVPLQILLCPEKFVSNIEQKCCPLKCILALQTLKPGYWPANEFTSMQKKMQLHSRQLEYTFGTVYAQLRN